MNDYQKALAFLIEKSFLMFLSVITGSYIMDVSCTRLEFQSKEFYFLNLVGIFFLFYSGKWAKQIIDEIMR